MVVASLSVPAGMYSLAAKLYIRGEDSGNFETDALCRLSAGSDSDFDQVTLGSTGGYDVNATVCREAGRRVPLCRRPGHETSASAVGRVHVEGEMGSF